MSGLELCLAGRHGLQPHLSDSGLVVFGSALNGRTADVVAIDPESNSSIACQAAVRSMLWRWIAPMQDLAHACAAEACVSLSQAESLKCWCFRFSLDNWSLKYCLVGFDFWCLWLLWRAPPPRSSSMEPPQAGWLPPKTFSSSAAAIDPKCEAASASETERVTRNVRVLVAGAGALGCEILRTLALYGVKDIAVIDMDVIEESNLNRQTLFATEEIGQSKALTAAATLRERFRDCNVVGYHAAIQDMPLDFFRSFHVIVSALDSIEARRWLNSCIFHIARPVGLERVRDASYTPVLIDGGTEGLAGQARTIRPYETPCIECTVDLYADDGTQYPLCTVAGTPREPEHCIEYAASVLWPSQHNESHGPLDPYNAEHIEWVYGKARQRAEQFGIDGVTVSLVKHVLQHSVPAVATTNAFIGAACALEVIKLASGMPHPIVTWLAFNGTSGICIQSLRLDRRYSCPICGPEARITIQISGKALLRELVELLRTHPELRCRNPSLVWAYRPIYMSAPRSLEEVTRQNLDKPLNQILVRSQNEENSTEFMLTLTDSGLRLSREMRLILL